MKFDNKSEVPPVENELWLPPLTRKTEEDVARLRGNKDKTKKAEGSTERSTKGPKEEKRILQRLKLGEVYKGSLGLVSKVSLKLGFKGKALWDWLPLMLAILGILAIVGSILIGLSRFATQIFEEQRVQQILSQQQIEAQKLLTQQQQQFLAKQLTQNLTPLVKQVGGVVDQQHDLALTNYLDYISALLLSRSSPLLLSKVGSMERTLAQTRTLAILTDLSTDALRKGIVIQFLHDTGLILVNPKEGPIIQLANIDLSGISLKQANLASANFDGVILSGADLDTTILTSSSFRGATLTKVNFSQADLENADFSGANLENATFTGAALKGINLSGADTKNAKQTGTKW